MEGAFFAPKAKGRVLTMTYDTSPASPQRIELSGRESLTGPVKIYAQIYLQAPAE